MGIFQTFHLRTETVSEMCAPFYALDDGQGPETKLPLNNWIGF